MTPYATTLHLQFRIAPTPEDVGDGWSLHNSRRRAGFYFHLALYGGTMEVGRFRKRTCQRWTVLGWFVTRQAAHNAAIKYMREKADEARLQAEAEADSATELFTMSCAFAEGAHPIIHRTETT